MILLRGDPGNVVGTPDAGGKMTKVRVLYRLPTIITVDLEAGRVESVQVDDEVRIASWTGACTEERGGRILRGATDDELDLALAIAAGTPWPRSCARAAA
jgi:hypothetical protein